MCKYFRSVYAFKIFKDQCPVYIHDLFHPCFTHRYPKRDTFLLYTPCSNIESNISKGFNSLPFSLRHITSLQKGSISVLFSSSITVSIAFLNYITFLNLFSAFTLLLFFFLALYEKHFFSKNAIDANNPNSQLNLPNGTIYRDEQLFMSYQACDWKKKFKLTANLKKAYFSDIAQKKMAYIVRSTDFRLIRSNRP